MEPVYFPAPRDYPELGIACCDLCRFGEVPGSLEVYKTIPVTAEEAAAIRDGASLPAVRMLADGTPAVSSPRVEPSVRLTLLP